MKVSHSKKEKNTSVNEREAGGTAGNGGEEASTLGLNCVKQRGEWKRSEKETTGKGGEECLELSVVEECK